MTRRSLIVALIVIICLVGLSRSVQLSEDGCDCLAPCRTGQYNTTNRLTCQVDTSCPGSLRWNSTVMFDNCTVGTFDFFCGGPIYVGGLTPQSDLACYVTVKNLRPPFDVAMSLQTGTSPSICTNATVVANKFYTTPANNGTGSIVFDFGNQGTRFKYLGPSSSRPDVYSITFNSPVFAVENNSTDKSYTIMRVPYVHVCVLDSMDRNLNLTTVVTLNATAFNYFALTGLASASSVANASYGLMALLLALTMQWL